MYENSIIKPTKNCLKCRGVERKGKSDRGRDLIKQYCLHVKSLFTIDLH
jgi:hypothetical protein